MRILVIEDDDNKFNKIYNTLNNILNHCEIIRTKSRNSGLSTFFESLKLNEKFDLIICDNFLPFFDDEIDLLPFASEIIELIKSKEENIPICVISYDNVEDCDYDYYIHYYPLMDLDKYFKDILEDIKQNKIIKPKVNQLMKKEER